MSPEPRDISLDASGSCVDVFTRYTTSVDEDVVDDGDVRCRSEV